MPEQSTERRMILCAGLQSGGTTLVSWCFLQRQDTNGVLDMRNNVLRVEFDTIAEPIVWVKMTVGAFRWLDVYETYRDLGWRAAPLLVVRDVRTAYSSLIRKRYGFNGTTAEEPPLRMRFRRFLRDWEIFRASGWPIIRYEDFVRDYCGVLREACRRLALPWDEDMVSWPKRLDQLADVGEYNETFTRSIAKGSLAGAVLKDKAELRVDNLPQEELDWLEETFRHYNEFHQYPENLGRTPNTDIADPLPAPRFEGTTRHRDMLELERLRSQKILQELAALTPVGSTLILVGQEQFDGELINDRQCFPFLERDGQYWGLPPDDETAISELERLRRAGADFIVFLWSTIWWLDHYQGLDRYLRTRFPRLLENERFVAFDLRT